MYFLHSFDNRSPVRFPDGYPAEFAGESAYFILLRSNLQTPSAVVRSIFTTQWISRSIPVVLSR